MRFLKIEDLLAVEGAGERLSMSPSSSEMSSFKAYSLSAPADGELDMEEDC
jgi:hypothetical protein